MSKQATIRLQDIAELFDSQRVPLSSKQRAKRKGIYPYYGASGIIDYVDGYLFDGEYVLVAEDGENLRSRKTPIAFKANGKFWVNNHAHILKGKERWQNDLIVYLFKNSNINPYITGAAQPKLNQENLLSIEFEVPEGGACKQVVEILSSLDEKIEFNRKQNRTLEAIAQALFKRWFVEFEFPDENGRPYKSSGGAMQPSDKSAGEPIWTAESRPEGVSAMDGANQLGEMEHVPLSDIVELNPRCALKKGELATYVEMKALPTSGMSVSEVIKKEFSGGAKFSRGDTLLARITPCLENGKTAYVDFLEDGEIAFGSTEFIVMRAKRGVSPQFVYCLAREPLFRQYAIKSMVGSSGRQRVQVDQIAKFPVLCPTPELMQQFDEVSKPLFDKISCNRQESFTLSNLRDTLLPKLMSGELRVGEAADLAEAMP